MLGGRAMAVCVASRGHDKAQDSPLSFPTGREPEHSIDLLDHLPPLTQLLNTLPDTAQAHSRTASFPFQLSRNHDGMDSQLLYLRRSSSPSSSSIRCSRPSSATARARPQGRLPREPDRTHFPAQALAPRCQECGLSPGPSARVRSSFAGGLARDTPNARTFAGAASRAWVCGGTEQRYVFLFRGG